MPKLTKKFFREIGEIGRKNRWAMFTPKQRSEQMRELAFKRHRKKYDNDEKFGTELL